MLIFDMFVSAGYTMPSCVALSKTIPHFMDHLRIVPVATSKMFET